MKIKPLRDFVVILPDQAEEQTSTGIVLVGNQKETGVQTGTVVNVGPGVEINEKFDTMVVQPGNRVLFNKGTGQVFEIEKTKYLFIKQRDLMGILR